MRLTCETHKGTEMCLLTLGRLLHNFLTALTNFARGKLFCCILLFDSCMSFLHSFHLYMFAQPLVINNTRMHCMRCV